MGNGYGLLFDHVRLFIWVPDLHNWLIEVDGVYGLWLWR